MSHITVLCVQGIGTDSSRCAYLRGGGSSQGEGGPGSDSLLLPGKSNRGKCSKVAH